MLGCGGRKNIDLHVGLRWYEKHRFTCWAAVVENVDLHVGLR